jgi:hypothetical protein
LNELRRWFDGDIETNIGYVLVQTIKPFSHDHYVSLENFVMFAKDQDFVDALTT